MIRPDCKQIIARISEDEKAAFQRQCQQQGVSMCAALKALLAAWSKNPGSLVFEPGAVRAYRRSAS